jgi:hypothetical protein
MNSVEMLVRYHLCRRSAAFSQYVVIGIPGVGQHPGIFPALPGQARDVCHLMPKQHMPQRLNEMDGGVLIDQEEYSAAFDAGS